MHRRLTTIWIVCVASWSIACHISTCAAQGTPPITPSGLNTQVHLSTAPPVGTVQYNITGGTRAGTNLFHSFGEFSVPNSNIANFLNDTRLTTSNILGRVTGGNVSNIFGTIQTTAFGDANLFLINPSGIIFGPNASLSVGGSVTFTTADYLRLDKVGGPNAGLFHADPAQVSLLTSASVDAFGFLGTNPAAITVQGSQLAVTKGHDISLVGGSITIQNGTLSNGTVQPAHLLAPNGQINLATAMSPGEFLNNLPVEPDGSIVRNININGDSFKSFGSVHLASGSTVDVSQTGKGKVSIRSGQLILEVKDAILDTANSATLTSVAPGQDSILLTPQSSVISETFSADHGPDIRMEADKISIIGVPGASNKENFTVKPFTGISSDTQGTGNAGNIILRATGNVQITKVVSLFSTTEASGHAGNIELTSTHANILMTKGGKESGGVSGTSDTGNTGNVTVSAREGDIVLDGAGLNTLSFGTGRAGQVEIAAKTLWMKAGTLGNFTAGMDQPGGITVTLSGTLTMISDPSLALPIRTPPDSLIVSTSVSRAPSGDITLAAKDILVSQRSIFNNASFASGPGGHLKIVTDTLQILDGAQLSSGSTRAPDRGTLRSFVEGVSPTGPGGNITIQASAGSTGSVVIDGAGSGIFADTEGTGAGGSINLSAKTLTIQNGGTISASTTGTDTGAVGGSIIVNVSDQVTMSNGASITASSVVIPKAPNTGISNAGNISINAGQQLDVRDSSITTKAEQASGGNIGIKAVDRIRLVNGSITTSVPNGTGNGGNITIDPNVVVLQNSNILAQAARGQGGNIDITTPVWVQDQTSQVDASSQFGMNGTVTIQSPVSNISGTVGQLVSKMSPPQVLLQNRCMALAAGEQSTFLLSGRETLPHEPGGWLSSPVSVEHWTEENTQHAAGLVVQNRGLNAAPTVALQKNTPTMLSLRRLTPPGFLVQTFATETTGCPS